MIALSISNKIKLSDKDLAFVAIRAQGPGGQHVNKCSTAIQLRFDFENSDLPDFYKEKLRALKDSRVSSEGVIVIKSQRFRSQEKNKQEALDRLVTMIKRAVKPVKKRKASKPSKAVKDKRKNNKMHQSARKKLRSKKDYMSG